jgi:serine/threonine-protein kinase
MATVYLARRETEQGLGPAVAVKRIHPHLANDRDFIEMFMDEAELASRIRHPNVCAVLDYDLREESYLVMEYLVGESMMAVAKAIGRSGDGDLERRAACVARMLADACEGLHAAHELTDAEGTPLHVVHRDVSLENVFVTYDGVAKVMDFGVATAANKRHQTRTGMVKGKFASVAPECLKGHKPDRRADVWGIGVIAWELLTGRRLFRRDTDIDTLCAVSEAVIQRPSECCPGLPPAVDAIVMRALARDPDQRYATARELGRDLARFSARGGEVSTCADVAGWLDELFPGGRQRRQQIVELSSHAGARSEHDGAAQGRAPSQPPPAAPFLQEPTLATKLWLGARRDSTPPPPRASSPPLLGVPLPTLPNRRPWRWRTGLVIAASAAAGAFATLLVQALLQGAGQPPSHARPWSVRAPAASAGGVAKAAVAAAPPREIVLRIRIDSASPEQTPTLVVDEEQVETATLEAAAAVPWAGLGPVSGRPPPDRP